MISNKTYIYINIKHIIFKELVPSVLPLLKKHIWLGHSGIVEPSIDLKQYKKGTDRSNEKLKILCKCITANTSAIWQHAAHTTDQLTSFRNLIQNQHGTSKQTTSLKVFSLTSSACWTKPVLRRLTPLIKHHREKKKT